MFHIEAITIAPFKHSKYDDPIEYSINDSFDEVSKIYDYLGIQDKSNIYKVSKNYMTNGYNELSPAVAIKMEPAIISKIKLIWIGSNFLYGKNMDFNFRQDILSTRYIFESKIDLTVIPTSPISSNLLTSIYELEGELKGKNDLCDYLCYAFKYRFHGIHKRWPLWDVAAVAFLINESWFNVMSISCPKILEDNTFELTTRRHPVKFVNYLNAVSILNDLFYQLSK